MSRMRVPWGPQNHQLRSAGKTRGSFTLPTSLQTLASNQEQSRGEGNSRSHRSEQRIKVLGELKNRAALAAVRPCVEQLKRTLADVTAELPGAGQESTFWHTLCVTCQIHL